MTLQYVAVAGKQCASIAMRMEIEAADCDLSSEDWKVDVAALWRAKNVLAGFAKIGGAQDLLREKDAMVRMQYAERQCEAVAAHLEIHAREVVEPEKEKELEIDIAAMWRTCNVLFDLRQQHEERRYAA